MFLNIIRLLIFFLCSAHLCCGIRDIPFFDETPLCSDGIVERRETPIYEFEKSSPPLDRELDVAFSPELSMPISRLRPFSGANDLDVQYMTTPQLRLKKRSVAESEESTKNDEAQYEFGFLTPLMREARDKEDVKTIHLQTSFIPRLGRKRSQEVEGDMNEEGSYKTERSHDSKAETLGRSEKKNKINLFAGSAFTPRLGRSEGSPRIRFQAGSAFTPRLGRSSNLDRVIFDSRAAFTPRQLASNRVNLNAGSAFTPRLGRSSNYSKIYLNAGNSPTPRLGRSEDRSKIQLNAGSAFTPRLG